VSKFKVGQKVLLNLNGEELEIVEFNDISCTVKDKKGNIMNEFTEDLQPLKRGKPKKNHNADAGKSIKSASLTDMNPDLIGMNVNKITKKDVRFKSYFIISASEFDSLSKVLQQIEIWQALGEFKEGTKVYQITEKTTVYEPKLGLEKCEI
jgi:hypothetical protein